MRGRINTTGVNERGVFDLLPKGKYYVKIVECAEKMTKNQDPMIFITMQILEGKYTGRKIFDNIIIPNAGSPAFKIMGRTKHFLHVIAEPYEGDIEWDSSRWLFKQLKVEVFIDEYLGQKRNQVANYILEEDQDVHKSDIGWGDEELASMPKL